jgi:hypothetical protein
LVNSSREALTLQRELLALISEEIPAAQGAIVLQPNSNEEASAASQFATVTTSYTPAPAQLPILVNGRILGWSGRSYSFLR